MRYFFDVHNGNELTRDEVGMELRESTGERRSSRSFGRNGERCIA